MIVETQRLQHERARVVVKRGKISKSHDSDDEENEEIPDVIEPENVDAKMVTLDLIKAIDQTFDNINASLRPSVEILSTDLAVAASVNTDIFSSRMGGSSTNRRFNEECIMNSS